MDVAAHRPGHDDETPVFPRVSEDGGHAGVPRQIEPGSDPYALAELERRHARTELMIRKAQEQFL